MQTLPPQVLTAVHMLEEKGFHCHIVGGCVRDLLLGRRPSDYDLTTDATPEQMQQVFASCRTIETGLAHGTLTILLEGMSLECTTYRVDGAYSDGRHPDSVRFTPTLEEDLARRDFTVNAMAYHPRLGLTDPFGGRRDLERGILRCVGEPERRFTEDGLRILRCIRFASVLGFAIEPETAAAVHRLKHRLERISAERIRAELDKLLMGEHVTEVLCRYGDILFVPIPELAACKDFAQHSPYHRYDVWTHTAHSVGEAPKDPLLRLTMLLHDVGKPECFTMDGDGRGHFKGHAARGAALAAQILPRLRYDRHTCRAVTELIARHADKLRSRAAIRHVLSELGPEQFFRLIDVMCADNSAKQPFCLEELPGLMETAEYARRLLDAGACLTVRQLAVDGRDMAGLGARGRQIGQLLHMLLDAVLEERADNNREQLLALAEESLGQP